MTSTRTITWAAIGAGDVFRRKSGPPLYQVPGSRLAGVWRRDAAATAAIATEHGCRAYPSRDALLADPAVDAVYVCTPVASHEEHTLAALAAGKHVLVEKEMASDADACRRMIAAAERAGRSLTVAFYRRCYPSVLRARALLAAGAIGRVRALTINDEFPLSHRLDLARFLLGPLGEVHVAGTTLPAGSHATRGPLLTARAGGATISMPVGWSERTHVETLTFTGDRGTLAIADLKAGRLRLDDRNEDVGGLPWTHTGIIADVVTHLRDGTPAACPAAEGLAAQEVEDAVQAAVR